MKKGFFKFMTSVAILASVFAFVSCEEDKEEKPTPPPSGDHDFTNTGMPVSVFGVEYYGKTFGNYDLTDIATAWDMRVFDKDTTLADAPITKFLAIILLADPSLKVEERLPVGEYEVTTSGMLGDFAPGKIVASGYAMLEENAEEVYFTEGTVKITKHGTRYCIEADLTAEDDTKFKFKYHPEEDFKTNDATFLSELTENVVSEIDSIEFKYYGNYESPNTGTWTGYMIADGLELNDNGTLAQGAVGKTLNFQFYTDGKKFLEDGITPDPSGRYTFDMSLDAWTAEDGTVKDGGLNGSWLYDFNDGAMKHAPMRGGFLEIERAEDGTFTVALETSDDNPYEGQKKSIKASYEGKSVRIVNTIYKGDFQQTNFYLRGQEFQGSGAKDVWTIELSKDELTSSKFQNGEQIILDIVSNQEGGETYSFDIAGEYTFDADNNTAMHIPRAAVATFVNGVKTYDVATGGSMTIEYDEATYKYTVNVEGLTTESGMTYNGVCVDMAEVGAGYPTDRTFNPEGAEFKAEFYGAVEGFQNWFISLRDAGQVNNDEVSSLGIMLDLFVEANKTFEDGFAGEYDFVGNQLAVGVTTFQSYTGEYGNEEGHGSDPDYIAGKVIFERVSGNTYKVKLDLLKETGRKTIGEFEAEFGVTDYR